MSPFRPRRAPAQEEDGARRALERATAMLRQYERSGLTMVAIEDVLSLLGAPPEAEAEPVRQPPRDPRADPLTGAMWAGPPGSSPPGAARR